MGRGEIANQRGGGTLPTENLRVLFFAYARQPDRAVFKSGYANASRRKNTCERTSAQGKGDSFSCVAIRGEVGLKEKEGSLGIRSRLFNPDVGGNRRISLGAR